jgi:hypothetical protein
MLRILLALCSSGALAQAGQLVFTIITPGTCPVWISAPERSKDFGFQSLAVLNDSDKPIQSVHLKVLFSTGAPREEVVDSGHVYMDLEPGQEKRLDVFLGRIEALNQKLKSAQHEVAWVKITVESAEFADGSHWDPEAPSNGVPVLPAAPVQ